MNCICLLGLFSLAFCVAAQEAATLKLKQTISLPGVKGRFDHFALDAKGQRLFVAALGNNSLEVLDVVGGKHLKSVSGLHKPTGVLYLATQNQIAVGNGDDGTLKFFDGTSYNLVKSLGSLDDADNVRFDSKTKLIYLGHGDGALAVIDSATMNPIASIKLAAHPESFQLEQQGSRIFANVPDAKQIAIIDREKRIVTSTWPMTTFRANFPMALDEANGRLFAGCRQPARLVIFNTATGKAVMDLAISGDTDDLFYDAKLKRIYISCGEGFIDVVEQRDAGHYQLREQIPTRAGARTSFFSPEANELYLAVPARGNQSAEIRVFKAQR